MPEITALDRLKHATVDVPVADLILQRWSPRAFADKPVSEQDLKSVFTAAIWAASSFNEQPWRFIVGRKGTDTWDKILDALVPGNQSWAKAAPVLYATFAKQTFTHNGSPNVVAMHDVGAASANLSLQATKLGLHTHGMGGYDRAKLVTNLSVPADFEPVACWALGYLGDPALLPDHFKKMEGESRKRKSLDEIVFGTWAKPGL